MRIEVARIWVSPSTLHLRCIWGPDNGRWIRSQEVHIPLDMIPTDDLRNLLERDGARQDHAAQDPLF